MIAQDWIVDHKNGKLHLKAAKVELLKGANVSNEGVVTPVFALKVDGQFYELPHGIEATGVRLNPEQSAFCIVNAIHV